MNKKLMEWRWVLWAVALIMIIAHLYRQDTEVAGLRNQVEVLQKDLSLISSSVCDLAEAGKKNSEAIDLNTASIGRNTASIGRLVILGKQAGVWHTVAPKPANASILGPRTDMRFLESNPDGTGHGP